LKAEAFQSYVSKLGGERVTLILFGSRARGGHTALSDYDLLVIKENEDIRVKPHEVEPRVDASVFDITAAQLEEMMYWHSVVVAAPLEGRIILDNLGLAARLQELREKALREGASVSRRGVRFPRG